ncbi:hypothetical protein [Pseudoxanthomonas sp. UTMC 1351]|uniref:hypothetical protein n=1 Tax=Pseudoxanthomonas sp. UTMC 1351 TaxID=2695853 RepID=UPI0034CE6BCA
MPSFETLDAIADVYTPLLGVLSIAVIVVGGFRKQWQLTGLRLLAFAVALVLTYGLMILDARYQLWPALGLDYSTHTALALTLVIFLAMNTPRRKFVWYGSLVCYVLLMLYQGYHGLADIVTTAVVVGVPMAVVARSLLRPSGNLQLPDQRQVG